MHCRLSFLQSTVSFFTFEQFIFPAIYIRVLYLFFNISALYLLHFIFLHSHHLHHHNIHLVTQHQDRLVSRSVLKSLHPRQREPCGRDRSFLGPQSRSQGSASTYISEQNLAWPLGRELTRHRTRHQARRTRVAQRSPRPIDTWPRRFLSQQCPKPLRKKPK